MPSSERGFVSDCVNKGRGVDSEQNLGSGGMSGGSEVGFCASLRCGVVQSGEGSGVSRRRRIRMIPSPFQAKFFTRCRRRRRSNFEVEEIVREARKEPTDTSAGEKKPSKASIQEGRRTDAKDLFETLEGLKRPRRRHEPKERTDSLSGSDFNILTSLRLQPRTVRSVRGKFLLWHCS